MSKPKDHQTKEMNTKIEGSLTRAAIAMAILATSIVIYKLTGLRYFSVAVNGAGWFILLACIALTVTIHSFIKVALTKNFGLSISSSPLANFIDNTLVLISYGIAKVLGASLAPNMVVISSANTVLGFSLLLGVGLALADLISDLLVPKQ
ncbi:MAG: hypothetical protein Q8T09_02805 [Candidatus Melainabacteria bacterium]|nr:hypothetical protein [Candidatus Melainabacteria bacterium]